MTWRDRWQLPAHWQAGSPRHWHSSHQVSPVVDGPGRGILFQVLVYLVFGCSFT